jgi:hypothetical protein
MSSRLDEFRRAAADCLALARTTTDPATRVSLVILAQQWIDMAASAPVADNLLLNALAEFNKHQLTME